MLSKKSLNTDLFIICMIFITDYVFFFQYQKFGSSVKKTEQRAIELMNYVDAVSYPSENVFKFS